MDMEYKQMFNRHAFNCMPHTALIPDFRLCIGSAERLDSIPVLLFTDVSAPSQKPTFEDVKTQPIEKFGFVGDGNYVEASDFESDSFFDAIQSMGVL